MNCGDKFISVLSAAGKIPLFGEGSIFSVIDTLTNIQNGNWDHWRWLLSMESLGFLYVDHAKKKVFIERPSLIGSTKTPTESYYIGARTPNQLNTIVENVEKRGLDVKFDSRDEIFPQRIIITGDKETRVDLAKQMNFRFFQEPFSYVYALNTPPIETQLKSLKFSDVLLDENDDQNPENRIYFFNPRNLKFNGSKPSRERPFNLGLRELFGKRFNIYKFIAPQKYKVHPDVEPRLIKWFCLGQDNIHIGFNENKKTLIVPKYCPIPLDIGRSVGMCQCIPPKMITVTANIALSLGFEQDVTEYIEYHGVPEVIARIVANKIGTKLLFINY